MICEKEHRVMTVLHGRILCMELNATLYLAIAKCPREKSLERNVRHEVERREDQREFEDLPGFLGNGHGGRW
jgi:hypothetical protein